MSTETLPAVAPAEPTTPIRPSEALRLGRLLFPTRLEVDLYDGAGGACALGAIAAGVGMSEAAIGFDYEGFEDRWPELGTYVPGPAGRSHIERELTDWIYSLNDDGWSDDQIVAWLESLGL